MGFSFRILYAWLVKENLIDKEITEDDFIQKGLNGFNVSVFVSMYARVVELEKIIRDNK